MALLLNFISAEYFCLGHEPCSPGMAAILPCDSYVVFLWKA